MADETVFTLLGLPLAILHHGVWTHLDLGSKRALRLTCKHFEQQARNRLVQRLIISGRFIVCNRPSTRIASACWALNNFTALKTLVLERIGSLTAEELDALQQATNGLPHHSLRTLRIVHCFMEPGAGAVLAGVLQSGRLPHLEVLDLGLNRLGSEGLISIAAALPALPRLCQLLLGSNEAHGEGVAALVHALMQAGCCPRLQALELSRNTLLSEGAEHVATYIRHLGSSQLWPAGESSSAVDEVTLDTASGSGPDSSTCSRQVIDA